MYTKTIFVVFLIFGSVKADCPSGTVPFRSSCYLFNTVQQGFDQAEANCAQNGGHLVSIHDAFSNAIIRQNAADFFRNNNVSDYWIGANSTTIPNTWQWTDGSSFDFTYWKKGEPSNAPFLQCVSGSVVDGYWAAQLCDGAKPSVCDVTTGTPVSTITMPAFSTTGGIELTTMGPGLSTTGSMASTTGMPLSSMAPSMPSTTAGMDQSTMGLISTPAAPTFQCSSGWVYFQPTNSFYCHFPDQQVKWEDAVNTCFSLGGYVPSIHNDQENKFLTSFANADGANIWTGLNSPDNGFNWYWNDGTSTDYLPWNGEEPIQGLGECVVLGNDGFSNDISTFNQQDCESPFRFICKTPAH